MHTKFYTRGQFFFGVSLLLLTLLSSLAFGANRPVWWSLFAIGVFFLFLAETLFGTGHTTKGQLRKLTIPGLLFIGVIVWGWVQTLNGFQATWGHPLWELVPDVPPSISADPGQGRHAVMRLLCYGAIFVGMVSFTADNYGARTALCLIALFSTGLAIFGLYAAVSQNNPILGELADPGIVKASFVNRNHYATYASFGVLANLAAAVQLTDRRTSKLRDQIEVFFGGAWLFALGALICMTAVALTQSRAGAAAGLVGILVFLTMRYSKGRWGSSGLFLLIVAALGFVALTSTSGLTRKYLMTSSEDARFAVYPRVIEAIMDRPILGHGLGSFQDAFRSYAPASTANVEFLKAHNTYLELAFSLGIPAAAAYLIIIGWIAIYIYRGARLRKRDGMYSCFAFACLATAAFHSFFDFSLQIPAVAALFAAILGLGYAQSAKRAPPSNRPSSIDKLPEDRLNPTMEASEG